MGFFQDLKEDLSQAVDELVADGVEAEKPFDEDAFFAAAEDTMGVEHPASVEDMIAASEQMDSEPLFNPIVEEMPVEEEIIEESVKETEPEPVVEAIPESVEESAEPKAPARVAPPAPVPVTEPELAEVSDEVATITRMMTINGDVVSNGSLELIGAVNGNVRTLGKLTVLGSIVGNSEASEFYAQEAQIAGNIKSSGSVKVAQNTVIRGDIFATSAVIAGAVKGDIDVHGPVVLDSTAIVMGNIKAKAVQINNGAAIEGMCSLCYADVSPSSFFRD